MAYGLLVEYSVDILTFYLFSTENDCDDQRAWGEGIRNECIF